MHTLESIASAIGGKVVGEGKRNIRCVGTPDTAREESIIFIKEKKFFNKMEGLKKAAFILDFQPDGGDGLDYILIKSEEKEGAFIALLSLFENEKDFGTGVSEHARIDPGATLGNRVTVDAHTVIGASTIGDGTRIGANTVVGKNCQVGKNCIIYPRVTIYPETIIEDNVIIHSGVVIGADGYGYSRIDGSHRKIPQIGGVYIGRDVEIGANTTIDRATLGMTKIGAGTKIDNLVQIGHNVEIGEHCILVALCGIGGSVTLGNNVVVAGMVGIADHIVVEDNVYILAKSGVMQRRIKSGSVIIGYPSMEMKKTKEFWAMRTKMRDMYKDLLKIKKKIDIDEE